MNRKNIIRDIQFRADELDIDLERDKFLAHWREEWTAAYRSGDIKEQIKAKDNFFKLAEENRSTEKTREKKRMSDPLEQKADTFEERQVLAIEGIARCLDALASLMDALTTEVGLWRNSMMDSTNMSKKLLTVGEAQEILSIGRTRMFSLIATGQLRSILIGSSRRIPSDAVEEFVQELLLESNTDS